MKRTLLLFLLIAVLPAAGWAQSPDGRGIAPLGSYSRGDIDSINLYNGNLTVEIPLFSLPGREISNGLRLVYNSQGWQEEGEAPYTYGSYQGGWRVVSPVGDSSSLILYPQLLTCDYYPGVGFYGTWKVDAVWTDDTGAQHLYGGVDNAPGVCDFEAFWTTFIHDNGPWTFSPEAKDGSIMIDVGGDRWIEFSDGTTLHPGTALKSANGNVLRVQSGALPIDTLGRTISVDVITDGSGTYTRYRSSDANGNPQDYKVYYDTICTKFNPIESTSDCVTFIVRIELPNGLAYAFAYDHDQGFMTGISLPSAGYVEYDYVGGNSDHALDHNYIIARRVWDGVDNREWEYDRTTTGSTRTVSVTSDEGDSVAHDFIGSFETETRWYDSGAPNPTKIVRILSRSTNGNRPSLVETEVGTVKQRTASTWAGLDRLTQVDQSDWYPTGGTLVDLTRTKFSYTDSHRNTFDTIELEAWDAANNNYAPQGKTRFLYDEYTDTL